MSSSKPKILFNVIFGLLLVISLSLLAIATNPKWRSAVKQKLTGNERKLVAKVVGLLKPEGPEIQVFKVKNGEELLLEIYLKTDPSQNFKWVQTESLPENSDGYFSFQGNATNLALGDIDQDLVTEILAPTYDHTGVARLNIFKFLEGQKKFVRQSRED